MLVQQVQVTSIGSHLSASKIDNDPGETKRSQIPVGIDSTRSLPSVFGELIEQRHQIV